VIKKLRDKYNLHNPTVTDLRKQALQVIQKKDMKDCESFIRNLGGTITKLTPLFFGAIKIDVYLKGVSRIFIDPDGFIEFSLRCAEDYLAEN
jgi:hypothetical protein